MFFVLFLQDCSKQRQARKKTVSFSSMPSDRKMNSTAACMAFMMEGCEMKKVRSNSRMYNRYFLLDPDMRWLRWEPSKKDSEKAKLEIKSIKEVRLGKKTPVLRSNGSRISSRRSVHSQLYTETTTSPWIWSPARQMW